MSNGEFLQMSAAGAKSRCGFGKELGLSLAKQFGKLNAC